MEVYEGENEESKSMTNAKGKREKVKDRYGALEGVFIGPDGEICFDLLNGGHARIPQISHALVRLLAGHDLSIMSFSFDSISRSILASNPFFSRTIAPFFLYIKNLSDVFILSSLCSPRVPDLVLIDFFLINGIPMSRRTFHIQSDSNRPIFGSSMTP